MSVLAMLRNNRRLALALFVVCAGCSGPAASGSPGETDMAGFTLTSPSFSEGGAIPARHTCDGSDISPALQWQGAPEETVTFALIVDDPDAAGFIHWVAFDMPGGSTGALTEGLTGADPLLQGRNDFGRTGYGGPCPPSGTHHYRFTLWALSARLDLGGSPSSAQVRNAMTNLVLARTTLTATYTRRR